jgi:UPF0755 protein
MLRHRKLIAALTALLILTLILPALHVRRFLDRPVAPPQRRVVEIPPGASFTRVAEDLATVGVVADARLFKLLARWREAAQRIKAGEYAFEGTATPDQILERLLAGDVLRHPFTVPEGWTLRDIAARLETEGRGSAETFLHLARAPESRERLKIDGPSLEGYLFPETYQLTRDMDEAALIEAMTREFRRRLTPEILEGAQKRGIGLKELVILASIVQKEAGNREEMPLIASVFHNRLAIKMPLQADPTVIYGIADFDGNLTRRHLQTTTPYNTYRIPGLPIGPIANPGEEALRAVAFPAQSDYYYFVAKGDGTHVFAKTLAEHNANVRRYQLKR